MHKYHIIPAGGGRLAPFTGTLHKGGAGRDSQPRLCKERSCCQWADKGGSGDKNHICSAGISSLVGDYNKPAISGASPSCKLTFLLLPGMSTSGLSPEVYFTDERTLTIGASSVPGSFTRTYIAFA